MRKIENFIDDHIEVCRKLFKRLAHLNRKEINKLFAGLGDEAAHLTTRALILTNDFRITLIHLFFPKRGLIIHLQELYEQHPHAFAHAPKHLKMNINSDRLVREIQKAQSPQTINISMQMYIETPRAHVCLQKAHTNAPSPRHWRRVNRRNK